MDLKDRVAIVTGAARGIGRATAVALGEAGARGVVLADVKQAELAETAAAVTATGAEALVQATDVGDTDSLRALFAATEARFGRLDVLHNNAGIGEGTGVWPDVPSERVGAIVDVNLRAVILGTQLALGPMKRSGGGVIVNTSSGAAFAPLPPQAVYAATKAGVVHFTRSCTTLAESHGVRVNCVCPGLVDTAMVKETGDGEQPGEWLKPFHDAVTLLRPEDIAAAVLALVADDTKVGEVVTVENAPAATGAGA
jgi:3-oxoacyl-[acyl-carrier protein] reductase